MVTEWAFLHGLRRRGHQARGLLTLFPLLLNPFPPQSPTHPTSPFTSLTSDAEVAVAILTMGKGRFQSSFQNGKSRNMRGLINEVINTRLTLKLLNIFP